MDGRTDGRRDGRTDGGTDGRTEEGTDGRRDGRTEGRTDGGTDGRTDGRAGGRAGGRTDRRTMVVMPAACNTAVSTKVITSIELAICERKYRISDHVYIINLTCLRIVNVETYSSTIIIVAQAVCSIKARHARSKHVHQLFRIECRFIYYIRTII